LSKGDGEISGEKARPCSCLAPMKTKARVPCETADEDHEVRIVRIASAAGPKGS